MFSYLDYCCGSRNNHIKVKYPSIVQCSFHVKIV